MNHNVFVAMISSIAPQKRKKKLTTTLIVLINVEKKQRMLHAQRKIIQR